MLLLKRSIHDSAAREVLSYSQRELVRTASEFPYVVTLLVLRSLDRQNTSASPTTLTASLIVP